MHSTEKGLPDSRVANPSRPAAPEVVDRGVMPVTAGVGPVCRPSHDVPLHEPLAAKKGLRREIGWTLAAGLLVAAVAGAMLVFSPPGFRGGSWGIDFVSTFMPVYADVDRAVRNYELPLLSPYSWVGGNLAGEYEHGVFSAAHLLIVFVAFRIGASLSSSAAWIVVFYAAITGAGGFRLGRRYGLVVPLAMIVALAATLNGYGFHTGARSWPPAVASFAWLPWTWWGLSIAIDQQYGWRRFLPAGVFLYLLLAAGWPFTDLMAVVVTAWLCLKSGALSAPTRAWPVVAAWLLGAALASPAIVSLLQYYPATARAAAGSIRTYVCAMPFSAVFGTMFPSTVADWTWWGGATARPAYEAYCGLVPAVALLVGTLRYRSAFLRQFCWEFGLLAVATALCHWGAMGTFRAPFRWLPLFHLMVGLLGALALQRWHSAAAIGCATSSGGKRLGLRELLRRPIERDLSTALRRIKQGSAVGMWSVLLLIPLWAWTRYGAPPQAVPYFNWIGQVLLLISLLWMVGELCLWRFPNVKVWLPLVAMVAAIQLPGYRYPSEYHGLYSIDESLRTEGAFDRDTTYLSLQRFFPDPITRFANAPMYAPLHFVTGFSAMSEPRGYSSVFEMDLYAQTMPRRVVDDFAAPAGLLQRFGIDGLVLGQYELPDHRQLLESRGWECTAQNAPIFHRKGPASPRVWSSSEIEWVNSIDEMLDRLARSTGNPPNLLAADHDSKTGQVTEMAKADISEVRENRLSVRCKVSNAGTSSLVAFARPYYPGYRAFLNGHELPVKVLNGIQVGVIIPPRSNGELHLVFASKLLIAAYSLALASALFLAAVVLKTRGRSRARCGAVQAELRRGTEGHRTRIASLSCGKRRPPQSAEGKGSWSATARKPHAEISCRLL
jgi:hypothetical protein